jgi:type IV secretory pathway VirB6-like protein
MSSFGLFFKAAFIMYFVYVGYCFAMGEKDGKEPISILKTCILVTMVYAFAFEFGLYYEYVVRPIFDFLTDVLTFFLGHISDATSHISRPEGQKQYFHNINNMTQLFTGLDLMFLDFIKSCSGLIPSGWTVILSPIVVFNLIGVLVLLFAYGAMYVCFIFMFIMSYFMMWMLLYIGGIILIFGCFKETRGVFFTWCKQLANYALISIFTAMVVAICYSGISRAVFAMSNYDTTLWAFTMDFVSVLVWCFICLAITLKVPDLAAGLTSQMAGATSGIAGAISMAGGAGTSVVGAGMMGLGKGHLAAGKGIINNKDNIAAAGLSATETLKQSLGIKDPFGPR